MPTEIAQVRATDGEEIPLVIESEFSLDCEIAALIIADRCLGSLRSHVHFTG